MRCSILISTYGADEWRDLAWSRAYPSAQAQEAHEVIVLHEPEMTIAQVRNVAAEQATGDWLCVLDADDELSPGYVQAMESALERHENGGGVPPLLTPQVAYVRKGRPGPPHFLERGFTLRDDNYLVVGTLVERDLFLEVGGFSDYPHGFEDWSLWAKCWKRGAEIVQVPHAVYFAHWNPNSKHRLAWRDRRWQVAMHEKIRAELFPE